MEQAPKNDNAYPEGTDKSENRFAVIGPDGLVRGYEDTEKKAKAASRKAAKENRE